MRRVVWLAAGLSTAGCSSFYTPVPWGPPNYPVPAPATKTPAGANPDYAKDPDAPPAGEPGEGTAWGTCKRVRDSAYIAKGNHQTAGIVLGLIGLPLVGVGTAMAADSTAANNSGSNGAWVGGWAAGAATGAVLAALGVYFLNQAGDDRSTYWATNAALAQMRGDYNAPPASNGPPATSGHPTRSDMDWAACAGALKTVGTGDGQPDVALAAALGAGGGSSKGGSASGSGGAAAAPAVATADFAMPEGPQPQLSFTLDPELNPEVFKELQAMETASKPKATVTRKPAEGKKQQFTITYDTSDPEGKKVRATLLDLNQRFPAVVPKVAKPSPP